MTIEPILKIVVFSGDLNFSVRAGIRALLDTFDDIEIDVLLHRPRRKASRLVKSQFRSLKKHGVSWIRSFDHGLEPLAGKQVRGNPGDADDDVISISGDRDVCQEERQSCHGRRDPS